MNRGQLVNDSLFSMSSHQVSKSSCVGVSPGQLLAVYEASLLYAVCVCPKKLFSVWIIIEPYDISACNNEILQVPKPHFKT